MGILLCEHNFRDVWIRNESVRAEIGQILHTDTHPHTHTTAAKLVVRFMCGSFIDLKCNWDATNIYGILRNVCILFRFTIADDRRGLLNFGGVRGGELMPSHIT